jgi:amino-acid N-acetyltransferase
VDFDVQPRHPEDDAAIRELLEAAELPTGDLSSELLERFCVARAPDGTVVGAIGLESFGHVGLLRSLVVHPSQRGYGVGSALVEQLERVARTAGLTDLFLLTTTAADFFAALGYRKVDRGTVPAQVAASEEFRALCPASAVCQAKRLVSQRPAV